MIKGLRGTGGNIIQPTLFALFVRQTLGMHMGLQGFAHIATTSGKLKRCCGLEPNYQDSWRQEKVSCRLVDANYNIMAIDVGSYGKKGDSEIFNKSAIGRSIMKGDIFLPDKELPFSEIIVTFVVVGDEAIRLQRNTPNHRVRLETGREPLSMKVIKKTSTTLWTKLEFMPEERLPKLCFNRHKSLDKDKPNIDFNWGSQFRAIAELNAFAEEHSTEQDTLETKGGSWKEVKPRHDRVVRPYQLPSSPLSQRADSDRESTLLRSTTSTETDQGGTHSQSSPGSILKEEAERIKKGKLKKLYRKKKRRAEGIKRQPHSSGSTTGRSPLVRQEKNFPRANTEGGERGGWSF
ncbi:unnamed protein product [Nezara viridula]|uniref:Uncharacterized protein n=1 Tax=Nezara viridula TaxID=85310 RepID=A0A9P0EA74_NEZVI|nr:unnamed protein product [Nezara viridula]